jgi:hypothetical protein
MFYKLTEDSEKRRVLSFDQIPSNAYFVDCSHNNLTSLKGCPVGATYLDCSNNQLTSLEGCPPNVRTLYCNANNLTSLKGCSQNVKILYCFYNLLTSLEGCPFNVDELYDDFTNFAPIISSPTTKFNIKHGIFLERVARLIDEGEGIYGYLQHDPTKYLPQDLYDEVMSIPICPKCNRRGLLIHTIELTNKHGIKIPVKTCCI